jgi:hypothetical protein
MVNTTATQNIHKPEGTDDPKKLADYFAQTATDIDRRMAAHFYDLDRVVNPRFAVVRVSAPLNVDINVLPNGAPYLGSVPFDTVEIDTNGMADLSANAYVINLNETGYWWIGGYARLSGFVPSGNSDPFVQARATTGGGNLVDARHDVSGDNPGGGLSGPLLVSTLTTPIQAALVVGYNGNGSTSVTQIFQAELWALKVRDL